MLIYALALAQAAPTPLTDIHQRDIGCVAFFGVAAEQQRRSVSGYGMIPDVRTDGARWAGIVGERVMRDTGLPKEVVGFAIQESVPDAQRIFMLHNPYPAIERRVSECVPLMRKDLAEADAASASRPLPLPKPQRSEGNK
jgi:hypothetical protein